MNLKEIRTRRGMTQKMVAEYLGCSTLVYSRYETEDRMPSVDMLIRLGDCFGVTIDYLVGREAVTLERLSVYEISLVSAAREADSHAKEDALNLLLSHKL